MQTKQLITQIDSILAEVDRAKASSPHDDLSGGLQDDEMMQVRARLVAAIERLAPAKSSYVKDARDIPYSQSNGSAILRLGGILRALRNDYESGFIHTVEELVHGVIFDDFLEMATELLNKKYKDPAAVIAGSVLEEHIKKLALLKQLDLNNSNGRLKKFDIISIELVKEQYISEPQRKILAGWYSQRTEAAHGNYSNVIEGEVRHMIDGIREFMVRYPA